MLSPQAAVNANKAAAPALPQPAAPRSSAGPSFAQMLTVQAPPPAAPQPQAAAPRPSTAPAPHEAAAAQEAPQASASTSAPPKPATTAKSRGNDAAKPAAPDKAPTDADKPTEATADGKAGADEKARPATAGLNEFTSLIGLPNAAAAAAAAQAALQAAAAKAPAGDAAEPAAATATDARGSRRAGGAGQDIKANAATARSVGLTDTSDAKAGHAAAAAADASKALDTTPTGPHPHGTTDAAPPSFAASLQAASANAAPATGTGAAASAAIASPPLSAAFAPEVATRVSLMAVDGVQHAELQLNPADMGPVAVQIVVDGSQAQVSFHAVQAETRQALEQSLPDLAAALQGQGLTLSGGGVFQQAPQQQRGGYDTSAERGSGTAGAGVAAPGRVGGNSSIDAPATRRTVGLLDTFA